jgi:hypothetical protein
MPKRSDIEQRLGHELAALAGRVHRQRQQIRLLKSQCADHLRAFRRAEDAIRRLCRLTTDLEDRNAKLLDTVALQHGIDPNLRDQPLALRVRGLDLQLQLERARSAVLYAEIAQLKDAAPAIPTSCSDASGDSRDLTAPALEETTACDACGETFDIAQGRPHGYIPCPKCGVELFYEYVSHVATRRPQCP